MSISTSRLKSEYSAVLDLNSRSSLISAEASRFLKLDVPSEYLVHYSCKGLYKDHSSDELLESTKHSISISIPPDFPVTPPELLFLTPIFHPNINDPSAPKENFVRFPRGWICMGSWKPARSIPDLIIEVGEMIQQKWSGVQTEISDDMNPDGFVDIIPTPICKEAKKWIIENKSKIPIDDRPLIEGKTDVELISDIDVDIDFIDENIESEEDIDIED